MTIYTSPTCSKCKTLKKVLTEKGILFDEVVIDIMIASDMDKLFEEANFMNIPFVKKDEKYIAFPEIFKWALAQEAQS